jgi:hypothetical protein
MVTTEPYFSLVKTGSSSWAAVLVSDGASAPQAFTPNPHAVASADAPAHFPRLAIALVAFVIFAASITAGIEYIRQAGTLLH